MVQFEVFGCTKVSDGAKFESAWHYDVFVHKVDGKVVDKKPSGTR